MPKHSHSPADHVISALVSFESIKAVRESPLVRSGIMLPLENSLVTLLAKTITKTISMTGRLPKNCSH